MMEQSSITTRARAQKLNNLNESITESKRTHNKQSVRGKRYVNAKDDSEVSAKQSARKKSHSAKVTAGKSKKKNISSRELNMAKEAGSKDKITVDKDESTNPEDEIKEVSEDKYADNVPTIELVNNNLSQSTDSKDFNKTPKRMRYKTIVSKGLSGTVTPKSTPIKLSLTPHRSTKTPKKSPISLSSPKTHTASVSRLMKTPRKLSLTPEKNSCNYSNDLDDKKLWRGKKDKPLKKVSVPNKNSSVSSVVKNKRSISNAKLKEIVHRFSKSPKIVLRSPSKKSKSPKLNLSASKKNLSKKPLVNNVHDTSLSLDSTKSLRTTVKKTPSSESKNAPLNKRRLLNARLMKLLTASQMRDILAEPIVLLKKLSLESKQNMLTTFGSDQSNNSINAESSAQVSGTAAENRSAKSDMSAHLKNSRRSSTAKITNRSTDKLSPGTKHGSPSQKEKPSTPLMSSTPREEESLLPRVNILTSSASVFPVVDDKYPNRRWKCTDQSSIPAAPSPNMMNKSAAIEDVSKPSLLDVDISDASQTHILNAAKWNTTYDINEETQPEKGQSNKRDITYELKDPQTPGLRRMIRKRTMTDANLCANENVRKSCRVRFANVRPDENGAHNSIGKSTGPSCNSSKQNNVRVTNATHESRKVKILKFNQDARTSPRNAKSSPKINRVTPKGGLNNSPIVMNLTSFNKIQAHQKVTPKRPGSVEKKSGKKSSIKKVPNFRRIHEKMFAKSESVVDAKKRLDTKHLEFVTKTALSEVGLKRGAKLLPSDATNGTYNRFGFKLRKAEATHVILKKQTVFSRQKQQHETRTVLKSVRTNRRFELQMKARNITTI
ncbi:probable serine/threonine-protein kinase nek3 [Harpegnathos saltator]|uniref:Uncharacterized protein n=1 Tax=Harpegnathos saltator TaxID=610380 RepID=E2C8F1_HARSA|nr:probable serine/threonine-protein kinase nek3 [Harpegnathos saltator]XP_025158879.1 probable serine/threonine-protein kinase nek3 [Harpegnathos saltator]EFN75786.1 hypothetical protein EAI_09790 [Harpegnathos saltator]